MANDQMQCRICPNFKAMNVKIFLKNLLLSVIKILVAPLSYNTLMLLGNIQ